MKKASWVGILSITTVSLLAGAMVFFSILKTDEENREYVFWADFKDISRASSYIICGREEPTPLTTKVYTNLKELWRITIINRNHKDTARSVVQFVDLEKGVLVNSFVRLGNEWKRSRDITVEEWENFTNTHPISPEEETFINMCLASKQFI
ncbi:MAG: hypothetical protein UW15_C0010G0024 [Parcubacteria group bacterium GW2011_GWC1_44_10]|nr:MAG: hypothetical protein UW15_C0010G0024 [Parcubacteria group bacterium GW2011_GWC1_44_10]